MRFRVGPDRSDHTVPATRQVRGWPASARPLSRPAPTATLLVTSRMPRVTSRILLSRDPESSHHFSHPLSRPAFLSPDRAHPARAGTACLRDGRVLLPTVPLCRNNTLRAFLIPCHVDTASMSRPASLSRPASPITSTGMLLVLTLGWLLRLVGHRARHFCRLHQTCGLRCLIQTGRDRPAWNARLVLRL